VEVNVPLVVIGIVTMGAGVVLLVVLAVLAVADRLRGNR
jgi:hypothetical protein